MPATSASQRGSALSPSRSAGRSRRTSRARAIAIASAEYALFARAPGSSAAAASTIAARSATVASGIDPAPRMTSPPSRRARDEAPEASTERRAVRGLADDLGRPRPCLEERCPVALGEPGSCGVQGPLQRSCITGRCGSENEDGHGRRGPRAESSDREASDRWVGCGRTSGWGRTSAMPRTRSLPPSVRSRRCRACASAASRACTRPSRSASSTSRSSGTRSSPLDVPAGPDARGRGARAAHRAQGPRAGVRAPGTGTLGAARGRPRPARLRAPPD